MFDNYIIEIQPAAGVTISAGVIVRETQGFRFFAATHAFDRLEGQIFATPRAAQKAALLHVSHRGRPPLRQNQTALAATIASSL
jgi:hypothetical protein